MATSVQIVSAILDALAEHNEISNLTNEEKITLAREFTNLWDEEIVNDAIASDFLTQLSKLIRKQGRYHLGQQRDIRLREEKDTELDSGQCNF